MVARPPLKVVVGPMGLDDIAAVQVIERASFSAPWPANAYRTELETNKLAHYLVVRVGGEVAGFAGLWLMVDEAHVTTFAISPPWRRNHLGERLLVALFDLAIERRATEATLEVRLSNLPARRLYEKFGFRPVGIRPGYYSDNNEDALIMTTEPLRSADMVARLAERRAELEAAPPPVRRRARPAGRQWGRPMSGPLLLAIESSCDETGIALVEGGRRIRSNVVASQVALHAATGGIVPEVAARAHLRWIVPVLDACLGGCRRRLVGCRRRGRHLRARAWPARSSSGVSFAKAIARVRNKPLDPGQPPRRPRRGGLAARSGRGAATGAGVPPGRPRRVRRPHVPGRDARPTATTGSWARRSTMPPARHSTRSAGCSAWAIPGGPAIMRAAAGATDRNVVFPRAWLGDSYDFSFSGLKTAARRIVDAARLEAGLTAESAEGLPENGRGRAGLGVPGRGHRRARPEDGPGRPRDRGALDRGRRRRGGQPGPGRADGRRGRHPRPASPCPRARACAPTTGR